MKISFGIITLNEEENLRRCLSSCVEFADEIVVIDSGTTDGKEKIARDFNVRWERQNWRGYVAQKNLVIARASHEWIFSIDADEELSLELKEEIRALKKNAIENSVAGFSVPRCVFYEGRWIRHGDWYPDRVVRLFRKSKSRYAGGKVHERLEVTGAVKSLSGDLLHYSFRDAADHWARCEKYATLWAEERFESGKRVSPISPYSHAAFRWLRGYILRRGFLDGAQGRRIAKICAAEVFYKYQLLRKMNHSPEAQSRTESSR